MSDKQLITEDDSTTIDDWYKQARDVNQETLPNFIDHVMNDYIHDYGSYVDAVTACAIATSWACGDALSGFQASLVGLQYLLHWTYMYNKVGISVIDWDKMLYPQYGNLFEKSISKDIWERLQNEAKRLYEDSISEQSVVSNNVIQHWQSIIDGNVPFGYIVVND